jgi:hypothetical protein
MGNQTSSPQPSTLSLPSLPPVCDMACQRQKQLDGLKTALDTATTTKDSDPEGYEKARVAYYTLLEGNTWLATEKDTIAKQDIEPVLSQYSTQYNELKNRKKEQNIFVNLAATLKEQEKGDEEELAFLNEETGKDRVETDVLNRLTQIKGSPTYQFDWFIYLLYGIIGVLGLYVVYLIITKIISYIYPSQTTVLGGKAKT